MPKQTTWTNEQDKTIMKDGFDLESRRVLAEEFGYTIKEVSNRRAFLMRRKNEIEQSGPRFVVKEIRTITARPSFFTEDLDNLMRGNR